MKYVLSSKNKGHESRSLHKIPSNSRRLHTQLHIMIHGKSQIWHNQSNTYMSDMATRKTSKGCTFLLPTLVDDLDQVLK
jgi:hypothetical protein